MFVNSFKSTRATSKCATCQNWNV